MMLIDHNRITGSPPEVTLALRRKQTISFSHNQFSGNVAVSSDFIFDPGSFRLQHIDVSYNLLSGPISALFGILPSFRHLDLSGNFFIGPFPSSVAWDNIEFLAAANNMLTGTVPVGYPTLSTFLFLFKLRSCVLLRQFPTVMLTHS